MYLFCRNGRSGVIHISESVSTHYTVECNDDIVLDGFTIVEILATDDVEVIVKVYGFITVLRDHISGTAADQEEL